MNSIKHAKRKFISFFRDTNDNHRELSYFDVKALYDAAFAEKTRAQACLNAYKSLMAQAEALDAAYRAQIAGDHAVRFGKAA